jgi:hypothetical protein
MPPPGILGELAQRMAHDTWRPVPRRYTLVDAHTVDPAAFGFRERELSRAEMEAMLREALRRPRVNPQIPISDEPRHNFDAERCETVRFMSLEEYAQEAGPGELEDPAQGRYWLAQNWVAEGEDWVLEWKA